MKYIPLVNFFKKIIKRLFSFFGIKLTRMNTNPKHDPFMKTVEWGSLCREIEDFFSIERPKFSWDSPKSVLGYLSPYRIKQYHSLTNLCDSFNIDLSTMRIADVGTGVGYFLRHLHSRYKPKELWGFDQKEDDLKIAAHLCPEARLENIGFENLPKNKFDVVFLMQVIEHVCDPTEVVKSILKAVKPGGYLIITVPDGRIDQLMAGEFYPRMNSYWGHINFWSIESWDKYLKKNFSYNKQYNGIMSVESKNLYSIMQKSSKCDSD